MVLTELDPAHSKLLCALTLAVCKHLGEPTLSIGTPSAVAMDWPASNRPTGAVGRGSRYHPV
jgi:hypothetical protein